MPKPSQYSRARRLGMQGTLLGVLAATFALAAVVGRSRTADMAVGLTAKPLLAGRLQIFLPAGWTVDQPGDELPLLVTATEGGRDARDGEDYVPRTLSVLQVAPARGTADAFLREELNEVAGEVGPSREIRILGQPGVLTRVEQYYPLKRVPGKYQQLPAWYAAVVVPAAGPRGADLGVLLSLEGTTAGGPSAAAQLRKVTDALALKGDR